jgi:hypothetical protein
MGNINVHTRAMTTSRKISNGCLSVLVFQRCAVSANITTSAANSPRTLAPQRELTPCRQKKIRKAFWQLIVSEAHRSRSLVPREPS